MAWACRCAARCRLVSDVGLARALLAPSRSHPIISPAMLRLSCARRLPKRRRRAERSSAGSRSRPSRSRGRRSAPSTAGRAPPYPTRAARACAASSRLRRRTSGPQLTDLLGGYRAAHPVAVVGIGLRTERRGGLYLEDGHVAEINDAPDALDAETQSARGKSRSASSANASRSPPPWSRPGASIGSSGDRTPHGGVAASPAGMATPHGGVLIKTGSNSYSTWWSAHQNGFDSYSTKWSAH